MRKLLLIFGIILSVFNLKAQSLYYPPITGNNWDTISPSSLNWCQARIDSLYNYLQIKNSKSFIVLKNGKIVLEKYFGTYTADSLMYWASASKSLAGFITGIAQKKGYININNSVSSYLGNGWTSATIPQESQIKVKDLLQMTSGLNDAPTGNCTNEDTAKACLQYLTTPSTRWAYHTGAYRKIQDVVSTTVGISYNQITNNWVEAYTGMSGFWFDQYYISKARDMARFGLLCLNKGIWANDTILKDSIYFKNMVNTSQSLNKSYGYLWWLNGKASFMTPQSQLTFPGSLMPNAPTDMYCALGKNDQKIYVVPSQKLVVIRQGNSAGGFYLAASAFDNVLWDYINKLNCNAVGISEQTVEKNTYIYPNPSTGSFTISSPQEIKTITVFDVLGRETALNFEGNIVECTSLVKGIYLLKITLDNKQIVFKKLILN